MSDLPVSVRTIVRDQVIDILHMRKGGAVRVPQYDISTYYLSADETVKISTYCVIVTDESVTERNQQSEVWELTLKIVMYAHDASDPHAMIDGMIEDVQDAMRLARNTLTLNNIVCDIKPGDIAPDERTRSALPHGQAVRTWTMRHDRR